MKQILVYAIPFTLVFLSHYISTNMYAALCANFSIRGLLQSFMLTGSPMCNILLNVINSTYTNYGLIIGGIGTFLLQSIVRYTSLKDVSIDKN